MSTPSLKSPETELMTTSNTCIVLVVIPVSMAIWRNPVDLGRTFISSIAVDEAYEWLAPLSSNALNLNPPIFTTTTGWITEVFPTLFAVIPGLRVFDLSHNDVWCWALQFWHVDLLLQSSALCFDPVQLKHRRFSRKIFFLSTKFTTLSQLIALWSGLLQNKQPWEVFASWSPCWE